MIWYDASTTTRHNTKWNQEIVMHSYRTISLIIINSNSEYSDTGVFVHLCLEYFNYMFKFKYLGI